MWFYCKLLNEINNLNKCVTVPFKITKHNDDLNYHLKGHMIAIIPVQFSFLALISEW